MSTLPEGMTPGLFSVRQSWRFRAFLKSSGYSKISMSTSFTVSLTGARLNAQREDIAQ